MTQQVLGNSLRRAALTVHALAQPDRAWVLDALAPADRESLGRLLAELEHLGIPSEPGMLAAGLPDPDPARRDDPAGGPLDALEEASVLALHRVLVREPVSVTRVLLAMRAWSWRTRLLGHMDAARRAEVEAQPLPCAPGGPRARTLLAALERQLAREPVVAPVKKTRWQAAWARLRETA